MLVSVMLAILTAIFGLYVWVRWTYRRLIRECEQLPSCFKRWPIIGSLNVLVDINDLEEFIVKFGENAAADDDEILDANVIWAGPYPLLIISNPDDIRKISSLSIDKGEEVTKSLKGLAETGLLTASVGHWKLTRRYMTPVFHTRNCSTLMSVFNRNSRELVAILAEHVDKVSVDIADHIQNIGLKSVMHLIYGPSVEIDMDSPEFGSYLFAIKLISEVMTYRVTNIFMRSDLILNFFFRKEIKEFKKTTRFILASYKKCIGNRKKNSEGNNCIDESKPHESELITVTDVYRTMMDNHPHITLKNYCDEVAIIMTTGAETVSSVLGLCILALAQYPDMQEKLYKEVSDVVGVEEDLTVENLPRLTYLDQLLKETMRRYCTVPVITKKVLKDTKLSKCTVPAGTTVYINLASFALNRTIFADPLKFNPDNFSPSNPVQIEKNAFLPFSFGPRSCIGQRYAYMFMKVVMVHLVRKFRVCTKMEFENNKLKYRIALSSAEGIVVSLHSRD